MKKKPSVSFFCPAYQDEKNLPLLIPKVVSVLNRLTSAFEIVIVHDGSPDNTGKVADALAQKFAPHIHVVHHARNKGYGAALKSGFEHASSYDYVFYTDGDEQYDVSELRNLLMWLDKYDVVIGFRTFRNLSLNRHIQTRIYNTLVRLLFGISIKDINCSMKIIKRSCMETISLQSDGSFIEAELLLKLIKAGYSIKEVPVRHFARKYGTASGGKPSVVLQTLSELIREYKKLH